MDLLRREVNACIEGFDAPYELEIRYREPIADERSDRLGHEYVDA